MSIATRQLALHFDARTHGVGGHTKDRHETVAETLHDDASSAFHRSTREYVDLGVVRVGRRAA
jgi:hypothetical protein